MSTQIRKPPIGLKPKYIWEQERLGEICDAVIRYYNEGLQIPIAWIEEYNELVIKSKKK